MLLTHKIKLNQKVATPDSVTADNGNRTLGGG